MDVPGYCQVNPCACDAVASLTHNQRKPMTSTLKHQERVRKLRLTQAQVPENVASHLYGKFVAAESKMVIVSCS